MKELVPRDGCGSALQLASMRDAVLTPTRFPAPNEPAVVRFWLLIVISRRMRRRLVNASETILRWQDRIRQRRALHGLSDELLKDIGLTRSDVHRETTKRFWRN
jgi:uncharacterized protein YjiS (DUF1127 family)